MTKGGKGKVTGGWVDFVVVDEHKVTERSFPFGYAQGFGSHAQDDRG